MLGNRNPAHQCIQQENRESLRCSCARLFRVELPQDSPDAACYACNGRSHHGSALGSVGSGSNRGRRTAFTKSGLNHRSFRVDSSPLLIGNAVSSKVRGNYFSRAFNTAFELAEHPLREGGAERFQRIFVLTEYKQLARESFGMDSEKPLL